MNHHGIDTATLANVNARAASVSTGHKMTTRSQTKRQSAEEAANVNAQAASVSTGHKMTTRSLTKRQSAEEAAKRVGEEEAARAAHLAAHVQGAECAKCVAEVMAGQRAVQELWEPYTEYFEPWVFGLRMVMIERNNAM